MSAPVPTFNLDCDAIIYRLLSKVSRVYAFVTDEESVLVMQGTTLRHSRYLVLSVPKESINLKQVKLASNDAPPLQSEHRMGF